MDQEISPHRAPEPLLAAWIKWTMDFWESLLFLGPGLPGGEAGETSPEAGGVPGGYGESALKLWQAFFSLLSEPATVAAVFQDIRPPSETVGRMAQAGWRTYVELHRQWLAGLGLLSFTAESPGLEGLEEDLLLVWQEIHEEDFRRLLQLPVMRLATTSRELTHQANETFACLKAAVAELIYLLCLPLKKSFQDLPQDQNRYENGPALDDFKEYYKWWLRKVEGHYMVVLQSPEFIRSLSHTLSALQDFHLARQEILADALKILPLPTLREVDDLYREIHRLKKQVKELSRKAVHREKPGGPGGGS